MLSPGPKGRGTTRRQLRPNERVSSCSNETSGEARLLPSSVLHRGLKSCAGPPPPKWVVSSGLFLRPLI